MKKQMSHIEITMILLVVVTIFSVFIALAGESQDAPKEEQTVSTRF
jgi:hypothetical protein